jgi:superfamily I DNA/RNA helicase
MSNAHRPASLNPEQHRAATYGIAEKENDHGPLLIIAGAGSGKTETLAHRVAQLKRTAPVNQFQINSLKLFP